jgi:hypothetical protein
MMRQVMTARLSSNWIAICGLSLLSLAAAGPSCSSPAAQHGGQCSARSMVANAQHAAWWPMLSTQAGQR